LNEFCTRNTLLQTEDKIHETGAKSGLPLATNSNRAHTDITGWLKIDQELLPEKTVLGQ